MLFELITNEFIDAQTLYTRTHISAVQVDEHRYFLSDEEAEVHRDAKQLEAYIKQTLSDLKIAYVSLKLFNKIRMTEFQPS